MTTLPVPLLTITGPVGIGKSTTAGIVSELLQQRRVPHAVCDLDNVRRAYPAPEDDAFNMRLGFRNLATLWLNYRDAGARALIIPSVIETTADVAALRHSVPGAEIFLVRLTAALEVNRARIRGREIFADSLRWHLARAEQLERELTEKMLEDVTVATDGVSVHDVAREVLTLWMAASQSLRALGTTAPG